MNYYLLFGIGFLLTIVLICVFSTSTPKKLITTTPISSSSNIITFKYDPNTIYSTTNNIPKTYIMGTFNKFMYISKLSFSFDTTNSILSTTSSIKIEITDTNNVTIYSKIITDFTHETNINFEIFSVNLNYAVLMVINGENTKIYKPSISFTFLNYIPTLLPTTMQPTTLQPTTLLPTTMQPTTLQPTTLQPTTLLPTTMQPTTYIPTTMQPTTMQPTTYIPTTMQPTTLQPTTMQPTTLLPTTLQPTTYPTTSKCAIGKEITIKSTDGQYNILYLLTLDKKIIKRVYSITGSFYKEFSNSTEIGLILINYPENSYNLYVLDNQNMWYQDLGGENEFNWVQITDNYIIQILLKCIEIQNSITTIPPTTTIQPDPNILNMIDYSKNFYSIDNYSIGDTFPSGTTSDNFNYAYDNNINGMKILGYILNSSENIVNITTPQNIKINNDIYPVKSIGDGNFIAYGSQGYLMNQNINVTVQEPVEYINSYAFMGTNIVTLILPRTLKKIYDNSLNGNRMVYIVIPPNVSEIGNFAFAESSISKFYFVGPVPKIIGIDCFAVSILNPVAVFSPQNVPSGLTNGSLWNNLIVEINSSLPYYPGDYIMNQSTYLPTTMQPTTLQPTTMQPTTYIPTTMQPTTYLPTTMQPTTMQPTTYIPTTMQPTTMQPTTYIPTTMQPTTLQPTTMQPTTYLPTTMQPTTMQPTTYIPTTMQPTTYIPTTMQPTTYIPTTMQPTTLQPTTMQPTTYLPTTMQPTTLQPTTYLPTTTTIQPSTLQPTTPSLFAPVNYNLYAYNGEPTITNNTDITIKTLGDIVYSDTYVNNYEYSLYLEFTIPIFDDVNDVLYMGFHNINDHSSSGFYTIDNTLYLTKDRIYDMYGTEYIIDTTTKTNNIKIYSEYNKFIFYVNDTKYEVKSQLLSEKNTTFLDFCLLFGVYIKPSSNTYNINNIHFYKYK